MSLYTNIKDDLITAMKAKDTQTVEVLRLLVSSLKNKALELKQELEDADVIAVVKKDAKKIEDALQTFVQGEREDLADKARAELEVLKQYLPPAMSDEDLEAAVKKVIDELEVGDASGMGRAMGQVMKELGGQVDGSRVRAMVEKLIS